MLHDERAGLGYGHSKRDIETVGLPRSDNHHKMLRHYQEVIERESKKKKTS